MDCKKRWIPIHQRHDKTRDLIAKMIDGVLSDVRIEPDLTPLTGENLPSNVKKGDE